MRRIVRFLGLTSNMIWAYCALLFLAGLAFAYLAVSWEEAVPRLPHTLALVRKLLDHLAIALCSLGLIAFALEFRDWQEYFQKRIAETILQQSYLKTLDPDELKALQTRALKAFFKVEDLDRKGGLLELFHSRLHSYIASPYREDVYYQIALSEIDGRDEYWQVDETASYNCRAVGASIQDYVQWTGDAQPTTECDQAVFTVTFPHNVSQAPDFKKRFPTAKDSCLIFKSDDPSPKLAAIKDSDIQGYKLPLDEYNRIDGLTIGIHVKYKLLRGSPIAWRVTHPTDHFSVTVSCPAKYVAIVNAFGFDEELADVYENPGIYTLRYNSWLLPDSGVSIDLIARPVTAMSATAESSTTRESVVGAASPAVEGITPS